MEERKYGTYFINYHFFYDDPDFRKAFKGQDRSIFKKQICSLKSLIRPAQTLWENIFSGDLVFSITVDDGSRSYLNVIDIIQQENVQVCLCVCGMSTLHKKVLLVHKINLVRTKFTNQELYERLCHMYPFVEKLPLRGKVNASDLYRYDDPITRQLKMTLNYKLSYQQTVKFIDPLFESLYGEEQEMSQKLYLSIKELELLHSKVDIGFHGMEHRFWTDLTDNELANELNPPSEIRAILGEKYILSIPYGMEGAWEANKLISCSGDALGAFTMGRSLKHFRDANGFLWLHRFDQADLFDQEGNFKNIFTEIMSVNEKYGAR